MNNTIFSKVFNNTILNRLIFEKVRSIGVTINDGQPIKAYKWNQLLKQPIILITYNYLDLLKLYFNDKSNPRDTLSENSLFRKAIKCGSLEMFIYLLEVYNYFRNPKGMLNSNLFLACIGDRFDIVQYIFKQFKGFDWMYNEAIANAPLSGNLQLLKYLFEQVESSRQQCPLHYLKRAFINSSSVGNVEMLQFLKSKCNGYDPPDTIMESFRQSIGNGHFEAVEYLLGEYQQSLDEDSHLVELALENNHIEIFKLLLRYNVRYFPQLSVCAARHSFEMFRWVCENTTANPTNWNIQHTVQAVFSGQLDTVKWIHENTNAPWDHMAMDIAAGKGYVEILEWLHHNRTEGCSKIAIINAIQNGHLNVLKFMLTNRTNVTITWDVEVTANLELLQWLYANSTEELSTFVPDSAAYKGHLDSLRWLHENTTERCSQNIVATLARVGELESIKYLHEFNKLSRYYVFDTTTMDIAASNRQFPVVEWLFENRSEGCTIDALKISIEHGQIEAVRLLFENRETLNLDIKTLNVVKLVDGLIQENFYQTLEYLLDNIPLSKDQLIEIQQSVSFEESHESINVIISFIEKLK
ncbi:hypothetical protein PPL_05169 [Heterostelium album PN500]|uniref:Ankyrin repeat protein n=1 Tax=Heterostelium pallidum (strain ATCC 26659 / Pp 5 / PN500) TaxID=670386 RepID=D3B9M4_HETP5|nr:hypothetical protein PPL_05169 [Heterostelium album PN500]EFA81936.1 hypothetical protein PPL_05169 [Heterostelium album PN500]|eukprot:XP_020434053.1 hypothetical protein PPL_05169 [Heterostelium album PN500]